MITTNLSEAKQVLTCGDIIAIPRKLYMDWREMRAVILRKPSTYMKWGKIPPLLRGYLRANSLRVLNPQRVLYEISRISMVYEKRDFTPFHV